MASRALAVLDAVAARRPVSAKRGANIGLAERAGSALTGAALLLVGTRRRSVGGVIAGAVGGALLYRGARGRSRLYEVAGISTLPATGTVERTVTVNRSPEEAYAFCRDWTNLPRFMPGVLAVTPSEAGGAVWIVSAADGVEHSRVSLVADTPGEIFSWRHTGGATGAVTFRRAAAERGTEVRLALEGAPAAEVDEAVRRLKHLVETGETPTTEGQPAGPPGRLT